MFSPSSAALFGVLSLLVSAATVVSGVPGFNSMCAGGAITQTQFQNIYNAGYAFFMCNIYNGALVTDPDTHSELYKGINYNGAQSCGNAKAALPGPPQIYMDAYHIPKWTTYKTFAWPIGYNNIYWQARKGIVELNSKCSSPCTQYLWLVVRNNVGSGWSQDQQKNRDFVTRFTGNFPTLGPQIGIMTTKDEYQSIVGSTYIAKDKNGKQVPLWWYDCTEPQGFDNFQSFNQWTLAADPKPIRHSYQCNVNPIAGQQGVTGDYTSL